MLVVKVLVNLIIFIVHVICTLIGLIIIAISYPLSFFGFIISKMFSLMVAGGVICILAKIIGLLDDTWKEMLLPVGTMLLVGSLGRMFSESAGIILVEFGTFVMDFGRELGYLKLT